MWNPALASCERRNGNHNDRWICPTRDVFSHHFRGGECQASAHGTSGEGGRTPDSHSSMPGTSSIFRDFGRSL